MNLAQTVCLACCRGAMQITSPDDSDFVEVECDACDYREAVHRSRVDPEHRKQRHRDRAGFPAEFAGKPFERDDDNREAVAEIERWAAAFRAWRGLRAEQPDCDAELPSGPAIWGRQGRGKTHLLVRLGERLIEHDCIVLFRTARLLLRELRDFDGVADAAWKAAVNADVLLLDDLGAQRQTDWRDDQIAELIDERHSQRRPVALTINAPPGAWEQLFDLRTASRLRGMTFPVELDGGQDRRRAPHLRSVPEQ